MNDLPTDNPFRTPDSDLSTNVRVDGDLLVVQSGTTLPMRCIRTTAPASSKDSVTQRLDWSDRSVIEKLKLPQCVVTWYENPKTTRLVLRPRLTAGYLVHMTILTGCCWFLWSLDTTPWANRVLLAVVIVSFGLTGLLAVSQPPLKIERYNNGHFWLSGCGKEFLASLSGSGDEFDPKPGGGDDHVPHSRQTVDR